MKSRRNFNRMMGFVFMLVIMGVFCLNVIVPDKSFSPQENRSLQQFPKPSLGEYFEGRLETKLDKYASDQFIFRNAFIKLKASADLTAGMIYSNGVWKCGDSYLMENATVPTKDRMEKTKAALTQFRAKHPKMKMYFLLAPNSVNIMKKELPKSAQVENQNLYMDEMFEATASSGYVNIDLRDTFNGMKDDIQLYYRTDHHWTSDGAYEAYKFAGTKMGFSPLEYDLLTVSNDFEGTLTSKSGFVGGKADAIKIAAPKDKTQYKNSVIYYEDSKEKTSEFYKFENLKKKDEYTVFGGSNHPMYTIKTPLKENRRLLLVKDSYANSMIPFLAQHYREIVVVDPRYYFENIEELMQLESINECMFLYNANTFFGDDSLAMMLTDS